MNTSLTESPSAFAPMLNETETAKLCGVTVAFLRKRRVQNLEPRWVKVGRCVRYDVAHLLAFFAANTHGGENAS